LAVDWEAAVGLAVEEGALFFDGEDVGGGLVEVGAGVVVRVEDILAALDMAEDVVGGSDDSLDDELIEDGLVGDRAVELAVTLGDVEVEGARVEDAEVLEVVLLDHVAAADDELE